MHKMSSVRVLNRRATGGSWTATSASASTGVRWLARTGSAIRRAGTRTGTPTKSGTGSYLDRTEHLVYGLTLAGGSMSATAAAAWLEGWSSAARISAPRSARTSRGTHIR